MAADFSKWLLAGDGADYTLTCPADPAAVLYLYRRREGSGTVRRVGATEAVGLPPNFTEMDNADRRSPKGRPLTDAQTEANAAQVKTILAAFEAAYNRRAKG
jgi:hypothetical protein